MRCGSELVIKGQGPPLFLLLSWASTIAARNIIAHRDVAERRSVLGIDWSPAPPPEDGPPLSAGAVRDKSLLPVEIGAIVGAYLFSVCVVGVVLIILSRGLRRRLQLHLTLKTGDVELIQPPPKPSALYPSPISPISPRNFSYPSPVKSERNPYVFPVTNADTSPITPPGTDQFVHNRIVEADRNMAQRDLEDIYAHVMAQEEAKAAGVSPKEMPPPAPIPTSSPQRQNSPKKNEKVRPANISVDDNKSTKSRASSILSILKSPRKKSVRSMQISSPMLTPASATFPRENTASDEEPLSPRFYKAPPPPPVPEDQPYSHPRDVSNITPTSPTRSIAEQLAPYGPGSHHHRPNPSQQSFQSSHEDPSSATTTNSQTPLYPARKQSPHPNPTGSNPSSTNASSRTLPFRQFEPSLKSPSFLPTTKTTVLERKPAANSGPLTGGLKTPWSAGAVPYSPYQPFTPLVPITPRLVTKQERKAMKKVEKRAPVMEMVKSDDEMWGD